MGIISLFYFLLSVFCCSGPHLMHSHSHSCPLSTKLHNCAVIGIFVLLFAQTIVANGGIQKLLVKVLFRNVS